jgi:hypothetical protein
MHRSHIRQPDLSKRHLAAALSAVPGIYSGDAETRTKRGQEALCRLLAPIVLQATIWVLTVFWLLEELI